MLEYEHFALGLLFWRFELTFEFFPGGASKQIRRVVLAAAATYESSDRTAVATKANATRASLTTALICIARGAVRIFRVG
jgi:hypothetical protein